MNFYLTLKNDSTAKTIFITRDTVYENPTNANY